MVDSQKDPMGLCGRIAICDNEQIAAGCVNLKMRMGDEMRG